MPSKSPTIPSKFIGCLFDIQVKPNNIWVFTTNVKGERVHYTFEADRVSISVLTFKAHSSEKNETIRFQAIAGSWVYAASEKDDTKSHQN